MTLSALAGLSFATFLLGLSPGPAVFATIGRALSAGLGRTYLFILGIILGDLLFASLAMLGLAYLVSSYAFIFVLLKVMGSFWLFYLGYGALRAEASSTKLTASAEVSEAPLQSILSGFLLTASNPKDLIFFISFLPAFLDLGTITPLGIALAASTIALTFLVTLSCYALPAARMRQSLTSARNQLWLNRIAGVTLIAVGILMLIA